MLLPMPTPQQHYRFLVEALRLIGSNASVQKASIDEDALVTDEITGIFAMAYPYSEQLVADGFLSREALNALDPIHSWIWLDGDADAYFPEALSRHPHWENGRRLATRALELMGERVQPPDRSAYLHIQFDLDEQE